MSRRPSPTDAPATALNLAPNIEDGDGFYDELLQAHEGLDKAASDALNARLILVLCNHIGDRAVIREALAVARGTSSTAAGDSGSATIGDGGVESGA